MRKYIPRTGTQIVLLWVVIQLGSFVAAQTRPRSQLQNTPDKWNWLAAPVIENGAVTTALRQILAQPKPETEREISALTAARDKASEEGKRAANLLMAAALERLGNATAARAAYQALIKQAPGTPHAVSSDVRARLLSDPPRPQEEQENVYDKIADEPAANGWFLISSQWEWTDSRQAANRSLVDLRDTGLSFRLFLYLRSKSVFPTPYAYLFVLIVLSVGVKLLALPLYIRAARLQAQMKELAPEIHTIDLVYAGDEAMKRQRLMALYKEHNINFMPGCAVALLDVIFVIWALVALNDFSPQMALDGAKFWWIPDVLQRDLGILLMLFGFLVVQGLMGTKKESSLAESLLGMVVFCGILVAVAWYWHWPTSVIIFWILLSAVGLLINIIVAPTRRIFKLK